MIESDITADVQTDAGTARKHRRVAFGGPDRERWEEGSETFVIERDEVWFRADENAKFRRLEPAEAAPYLAEHAKTWSLLLLAPLLDERYTLAFTNNDPRGYTGVRVSGLGIRECRLRFDTSAHLVSHACVEPDGKVTELRYEAVERCSGVSMPSRLRVYSDGREKAVLDVKHTCSWLLDASRFVHPVL